MTEIIDRIAHYTTEFFKCYLCNKIFADGDEPWHIFEKRLAPDGQRDCPLAAILSSALGKDLDEKAVHSKLICDECNAILLEYEQIEKRFYQFRLKILTDYNNTAKENNLEPIWFEINDIDMDHDDSGVLQPENLIAADGNLLPCKLENSEIITHIPLLEGNLVVEDAAGDENVDDDGGMGQFEVNEGEQYVDLPPEMEAPEGVLIEGSQQQELDVIDEGGTATVVTYEEKGLHLVNEEIPYEQIIEQTSVISYSNSIDDAMDYNSSNEENQIIPDDDQNILPTQQQRRQKSSSDCQNQLVLDFEFNGVAYICPLCPEANKHEPMAFAHHLKTAHSYKYFVCEICHKGFHKRTELSDHKDEFHGPSESGGGGGEFHCDHCPRVFLNMREFRIHKRQHYTSTKQHECPECHKKYSSKNLLDEHMNMHTGKRPYKCAACSKDFASKYTLQAHMKIHTKRPRPYNCDECDKSFLNQQNLVQHKKLHLGLKTFVCEVCAKAFGTQHNLDVHKIVHSGNKPFICRTCGKGFARRAEIRDHERTHTGERPYKCDLCELAFAQRSNLMTHKKATHLNDKKHKCSLCERSFKRRRLLEYHKQSAHTGERPHKCEVCSATFVYPEHFKKHMRIHSGVKPYACEVCGKLFNSRDNRNAHRFIHSEKKPYECMECGMGFMRKPLLLSHMKHTRHVNDTIIVNQPQISQKGVLEVYKETEEEEQPQQFHVSSKVSGNDEEEDENDDYDEIVTPDEILVEDGDGQYIKDEDGEVKYLQFAEMDKDGQATFTWVDIAGDEKED